MTFISASRLHDVVILLHGLALRDEVLVRRLDQSVLIDVDALEAADAVQPVHRLGHRAAQLGLPISNVLGDLGRLELAAYKAAGRRHESSSPFKVER